MLHYLPGRQAELFKIVLLNHRLVVKVHKMDRIKRDIEVSMRWILLLCLDWLDFFGHPLVNGPMILNKLI